MTASFESTFRTLVRAPPARRGAAASALLAQDVTWPQWMAAFNQLYVESPEQEAIAAGTLAAAAGRRRRPVLAGRFRVLEGRALQRAGSPGEAVKSLRRAARMLRDCDETDWATQADVLCVDALAMAGRVDEALRVAADAARRIRGPRAALWRAALAINRANALRLAGDLREAIRSYERAAKAAQRAGDEHTAAIAHTNAGVATMDAGDAREARRLLEGAVAVFEQAGQTDLALEARYNLAGAMVRDGDLGAGLTLLERLEAEHAERGLHRRAALCAMDLADAFHRAGDHLTAERRALAAAAAFRRSGARAERVEALWVAAAAAARNAPELAAGHLRKARAAADRLGRPAYVLRCDLLKMDLDLERGRRVDARAVATLQRAAERLGQNDVAGQALLLRGHLALESGRAQTALRHFSSPLLSRPGSPWMRTAAGAGRALAEARLGRRAAALARLRRINAFDDAVRTGLPGAWLRTVYVLERLDPVLARVDLLLERGRPKDREEAEAVLDALAARRFLESRPVQAPQPAVRRRLEAIYGRLARGGGPTRGLEPNEADQLVREARHLEREAAETWKSAERRSRAGAIVATAHPRRIPLPRDVSALHVWVQAGRVRALHRRGTEAGEAFDLGPHADLVETLELLAFHDERARQWPDATAALERELEALAQRLLRPIRDGASGTSIRLVADPALDPVPWEVLPFDGRPLAATRSFLRVPSLRVRGRRAPTGQGTTVIALGEDELPGVQQEARRMAARARVLGGARATRRAVADALASRDVVHLAGHGFDAPEAPALGGVRVADGWFASPDLPPSVASRLVVLAACRTGRAPGTPGLAWGGLPSALLGAGARYVLWTTQDVNDRLTADLMERFHVFVAEEDPPVAFGRALGSLIAETGHSAGLLDFRLSGIPR